MHPLERTAVLLRRSPILKRANRLWSLVRPWYTGVLRTLARQGLERTINGTDSLLVLPELYNCPEVYEPDVWAQVMAEVRRGDSIADVGASIGLYTLALAKRTGPEGQIYAFEPDPQSAQRLQANVTLNHLESRVQVLPYVVGEANGRLRFVTGRGVESHVAPDSPSGGHEVSAVSLDSVFADKRLDILKIDVEGFEESVVRGAVGLLSDSERAPRTLFIEVHPFAWEKFGCTDSDLLNLLKRCEYQVVDLSGSPIYSITAYGEVVARRIRR